MLSQDDLPPKGSLLPPQLSTTQKNSGWYFLHALNLPFLPSHVNPVSVHHAGSPTRGAEMTEVQLSPTGGVFPKHRAPHLTFLGGRIRVTLLPHLVPARFHSLKVLLLPEPPTATLSPHPTPRTFLRSCDTHWLWLLPCASLRPRPQSPPPFVCSSDTHSHTAGGLSLCFLRTGSWAPLSASRPGAQASNLWLPVT